MGRPRRRLSAELCAVTLIVVCVAATLGTVIQIHRRPPRSRPTPTAAVVVAPSTAEVVSEPEKPKALPTPPPPKIDEAPVEPPEDPTKKIVAELGRAETEQRLETAKAEAQISALMAATRSAKAESEKWKRGMSLTKGQLASRANDAAHKEAQANTAWMERDALAKRRDGMKQTLQRDMERPSYAVLPHKGPNGTWQRPIVLECKNESVTLQPKGPTFELMELSFGFGTRNPPFVNTVTREAIRIQRLAGPDGKDVVPYIFFIIRPNGIRAYYEARVKLERLGIAFGYELADTDWEIDFPDLDQPSTWDGSPPPGDHKADNLAADLSGQHGEGGEVEGFGNGSTKPAGTAGGGRASQEEIANAFHWPKTPPGMEGRGNGSGAVVLGSGDFPGGGGGSEDPADRNATGNGGIGVGRGFDRSGRRLSGAPGAGGLGNGGTGNGGTGNGGTGVGGTGNGGGDPLAGDPGEARRSASDEAWERALRAVGGGQPAGQPGGSGDDKTGPGGEIGPLGGLSDRLAQNGGGSPGDIKGGSPGSPDGASGSSSNGQPGGSRYVADASQIGTNGGRANASAGDPGSNVGQMVAGLAGSRGTGTRSADNGSGSQTSGGANGSSGANGSNSGSQAAGGANGGGSQASGGSSGSNGGSQASSGPNGSNGGGQASSGTSSGGASGGTSSGNTSGGSQGQLGLPSGASGADGGPPPLPGTPSSRGGMASVLNPLGQSIRPLDLVVSCGPKGVAIHPGNYRVTVASLKSKDSLKDSLLVAQLKAIVRLKEQASDGKTLAPNIRYVVDPGGAETYATARSQIVFSGLNWPSDIQFNGADQIRLFKTDSW